MSQQPARRLRTGLLAFLATASILAILAAIIAPTVLQSRDLAGATPQRAEALIMDVRFASGRTRMGATNPQMVLRIDGREVSAIGLHALPEVHRGRRMLVTYLVGKSGQIYIEDAEPVAAQ